MNEALEVVRSWTVEVHAGTVVAILGVLVGAALAGYASGVARGGDLVDEKLADVGIIVDESENLITVHEPYEDKVVARITWDENEVRMELPDRGDQHWISE